MNEVINVSNNEVSESYQRAVRLHSKIMIDGETAAGAMVELSTDLKEMRDTHLYEEFGYSSFDEYTEKMVGIKSRQAYNYIKCLETYGSSVLQSNARLGITKLELISGMTAVERNELLDSDEIEGMSVAEVKELVKKNKDQGEQISLMQAENEELKEQLEDRVDEAPDTSEIDYLTEEIESKDTEILKLKKQISELNNNSTVPVEISETEKEALRKQIESELKEKQKDKIDKAVEKAKKEAEADKQKEIDEAVQKAEQIAEKKAKEKMSLLEQTVNEVTKQADDLQNQLKLSDSKSATAMVYINAIQNDFNSLYKIIVDMPEEQQNKFKGACIKLLNALKQKCEE